jgi:pimeloyl-ACP methyl ester carboxylesterase
MDFTSQSSTDGILERNFTISDISGILWSADPATAGTAIAPLVLMGHPGGLHKRAEGVMARAAHLVSTQGFHVASIDAPGHGDRTRSAEDVEWVDKLMRARAAGEPVGPIISAFNGSIAERSVPEWQQTLDALGELADIDANAPVGFMGMTLASEIGMRLAAVEPRIGAAVLGASFASPDTLRAARQVTVPVQYLLPWDDGDIDREAGLALFDALGSEQKFLHATVGQHHSVPWVETEDAARFFARFLRPFVRNVT